MEPLERELGQPPKPSIEEALKMGLKTLSAHLRYIFLGAIGTFIVIRYAKLFEVQDDAVLRILKRRKKAIGWKITNIHEISPALCMHRIYMEEHYKPSAQHQRRWNRLIKELVRKEVMKWLDDRIVYPISDSKWVNHVQCVPKRGV